MYGDVRTYIQSGNVIFETPARRARDRRAGCRDQNEKRFGFRVPVILRTSQQLLKTIRDNPFLAAERIEKVAPRLFPRRSLRTPARLPAWIPRAPPPTFFTFVARKSICTFPTAWAVPN